MIRISFALAAIAAISAASNLQAQQVIYSGEIIYSQPIYPVAQPHQYPAYQYVPGQEIVLTEVAPYPIEYPTNGEVVLSTQRYQPAVQPTTIVKPVAKSVPATVTKTVSKSIKRSTNKAVATALPTYRKSNSVQAGTVSNVRPAQRYSQPVISSPVIQHRQAVPTTNVPSFFAPQPNCFSGR